MSSVGTEHAASKGRLRERPVAVPDELWTTELELIRQRRKAPEGTKPTNLVGLALSGGGIRSATISLGLLQALGKLGLLRYIDYISSVSGGGYIASWLGGLYRRWHPPEQQQLLPAPRSEREADWERVEAALADGHGHPVDWLRENGRFLAPNGAGDLALAAGVVVRNLVALLVVLGTSFLFVLLGANGLRRALTRAFEQLCSAGCSELFVSDSIWWSPSLVLVPLLLLIWVIPVGIAFWLVRTDERDGDTRSYDSVRPWLPALLVCLLGVAGAYLAQRSWLKVVSAGAAVVLFLALLALYGSFRFRQRDGKSQVGPSRLWTPIRSGAAARNFLTLRLRDGLVVSVTVLLFALVDTGGQSLFLYLGHSSLTDLLKWLAPALTAFASVATMAQRLIGLLGDRSAARPKLPATVLASVAAAALSGTLLIVLAALAHALTWKDPCPAPERNPSTLCQAVFPKPGEATAPPTVAPEVGRCPAGATGRRCVPEALDPQRYGISLGLAAFLTLVFGGTYSFVNRSSLAALYGARLARAYLGASNLERRNPDAKMLNVALDHDDMPLADYRPHEQGGPLHIINVTLNETVGGRSQVELRDRKGMGMAIGPAGVSVGVRHHAIWDQAALLAKKHLVLLPTVEPSGGSFRVFPEPTIPLKPVWPSLGRWVAISGAAVSTGLGWRTSIGLSLLIGLFNLRLGHWWQSEIDPAERKEKSHRSWLASAGSALARLLPVQFHLLQELLARFPGTSSPDWYLTDGGHFENSGAYELIRRRLPLIVLCDNGADPDYSLEELGNLVRKARNDFDTSIEFASRAQIERCDDTVQHVVGTLSDLGFRATGSNAPDSPAPRATRYAALAKVTYEGSEEQSLLLYIRPAVLGSEPVDVLTYHGQNALFPQQSTGDQFFDEAQWESYRRLGRFIGDVVFAPLVPGMEGPIEGLNAWLLSRAFALEDAGPARA